MLTYADVCCSSCAGKVDASTVEQIFKMVEKAAAEPRLFLLEACEQHGTEFTCFTGTTVQILTFIGRT